MCVEVSWVVREVSGIDIVSVCIIHVHSFFLSDNTAQFL